MFRSLVGEAALTGLVAALAGLGLGVLAALGLKALLGAFGIALPSSALVFRARTPIVALAVGVGVTVFSAVVPARRAVRVPPVAALVDSYVPRPASLRGRRVGGGALIGVAGIVVIVLGLGGAQVGVVALGAFGVLIAVVALAPAFASPLARVAGAPLVRAFGVAGRLGRRNAMRNPRRTAQTAAALMIGLALVSTIAVLGASISASVSTSVDRAIRADYLITGSGGFSRAVAAAAARLPGVRTATAVYQGAV